MIGAVRFFIAVSFISVILAWPQGNHYKKIESAQERGRSGSMLAEIAKEVIHRSSTNTQVLSLNLSSLLLLLVLKAVVFGAGYMGHQGSKARELEEESVITESEVALALGYLVGDTCLYRAACENPLIAKEYVGAAEMLFQTLRLIPRSVHVDEKYQNTLAELKKAVQYGTREKCPPQYTCKPDSINNFLHADVENASTINT